MEAFLDLRAHRPVAVPAVTGLVHGRRFAATDAFVEHARKTGGDPLGLRLELFGFFEPGGRRRRFMGFSEGGLDGGALLRGGLRRDVEFSHFPV